MIPPEIQDVVWGWPSRAIEAVTVAQLTRTMAPSHGLGRLGLEDGRRPRLVKTVTSFRSRLPGRWRQHGSRLV